MPCPDSCTTCLCHLMEGLEEGVPGLPRNTKLCLGRCNGRAASCCQGCHLCIMEMRWVAFCRRPFGCGPWVTLRVSLNFFGQLVPHLLPPHTPHCFQGLVGVWEVAIRCVWSQKGLWEQQARDKTSSLQILSYNIYTLRKHNRACRIFVWLILAVDRKQTFSLKTFTHLRIDNTNMYLASA